MRASSHASKELSTASLTAVISDLTGESKPRKCLFFSKNSEMATALLIAFFITFYSAWIGLLLGLVLCLLVDGYEKDSQAA